MAQLTGATINVYSEKTLAIEAGARGVAAIALPLTWYEDGKLIAYNADDSAQAVFAMPLDDLIPVREMMKGAAKALVYPLLSGGERASATLAENVTATAIKQGAAGNNISVTVAASGDLWRVKTFLGTDVVDSQTVASVADFKSNSWIEITGSGSFAAATQTLTGGTNGAQSDTVWDTFLEVLKLHEFQTIAYIGDEVSVKSKIAAYVQTQRDDEDKFIQACMGNKTADHEGVISFANGVILEDGTSLDADQVSAWLAGATAGASVVESLTYSEYPGAVDVTTRLTKSQQLAHKNQGLGCFILNNGKVKVESDINTLVTYTVLKQSDFSKNRVLRVVDGVATDIKAVFDSSFAGLESNNIDGRNRFKASICDYLTALQNQGALEEFVADDVTITAGTEKDTVIVGLRIKPVDSMEKANITVKVR